jgi:hypothetical protein
MADTATADDNWIGKYVIVRTRDAGVHAGVLRARHERLAELTESRRLWYWKPANKAAFLSGVATEGLHKDSKIGAPIDIVLTENCEIIACGEAAEASIRAHPSHEGR